MEIDRRDVVTGLTATLAATSLSVLPAKAALSGATARLGDPRSFALNSLWHGQWHHGDCAVWLMRHVESGGTIRRVLRRGHPFAFEPFSSATSQSRLDEEEIAFIGDAARSVCIAASYVRGAYFVHFPQSYPDAPFWYPSFKPAPELMSVPDLAKYIDDCCLSTWGYTISDRAARRSS